MWCVGWLTGPLFPPKHTLQAPIVEALTTAGNNIKAAFFFPGHKMGRGLPVGLPGPFAGTKGAGARDPVWQYDVPEIPEMDNLFAPEVRGESVELG